MVSAAGEAARSDDGPSLRYLIARRENNRLKLLTLSAVVLGEVLPVFGTKGAAHDFLRRGSFGGGWQVRVSSTGELVSLLVGHLAGVERVVLDPSPGLVSDEKLQSTTRKKEFIAALMGEPLAAFAG